MTYVDSRIEYDLESLEKLCDQERTDFSTYRHFVRDLRKLVFELAEERDRWRRQAVAG